jgi:thiamine biosynthesis protein ThiI
MDKIEITDEARRLDTLEISNEPDADCCTLFVPAHPGTRLSRAEVADMEARLDIPALVRAGLEAATMETFDFPPGAGAHPARPAPRQRVAPPPIA